MPTVTLVYGSDCYRHFELDRFPAADAGEAERAEHKRALRLLKELCGLSGMSHSKAPEAGYLPCQVEPLIMRVSTTVPHIAEANDGARLG